VLRCCLKVMGQVENDMVLSTSAYRNGIRATMFSFDDKGIFYVAGRITGYALGQDQDDTPARRLLDDVLTVFGDAKALWCQTIAERLAGSFPEAYADITQETVASQLRGLKADGRGVRETGRSKDGPRSGCYRAELERTAGGGDA
jgi:DNA segregation ATPase FtsK/SpoIIIE, S-DNA-T family